MNDNCVGYGFVGFDYIMKICHNFPVKKKIWVILIVNRPLSTVVTFVKGGGGRKQGRMKLLLMHILKYFSEWIILFWQHQWIVQIKFLNWYKTHFLWTLKNDNELICQTFFCVCSKVPYWTHQIFFLAIWKVHGDFWVLYIKNLLFVTTSVHCIGKYLELVLKKFFMNLDKKKRRRKKLPNKVLLCSIWHLQTHYKFLLANLIIIMFQPPWKVCFVSIQKIYCNNSLMLSK